MSVQPEWEEQDSRESIELGEYFVPDREVQMGVVASLVPDLRPPSEILDLCCGQGRLSAAIRDVLAMLRPGGALVIADVIQSAGPRGSVLARRMWDEPAGVTRATEH